MDKILHQLISQLRSMWRYRWHAMALTWLIVSIGWYMVYKLPDVYRVSAIVHVNTESVLRPLLQGMVIEPNIEQRLRLLSRTLKARPNMAKLAQMSESVINKNAPGQIKISVDNLVSNIELTNSRTEENIYTISYHNTNPKIAKVVVDNLLKIIIENTMEQTDDNSSSAENFLKGQLSILNKKLYEAEDRLKEFKRSNAELMPSLGQGYFANLQAVRESLATAELELSETIKRRDELKRQIGGEEPVFGFASTEQASPHPLDSQIQELQNQLNELLLQYTELHPKVSTLKESIERLENKKQKDLASRPNLKNISPALETNPVYQQLSVSLSEAEAEVASLHVRVREYKQREAKLQQMVDTIPQFEAELNRLNRDVEIQRANYDEMLERYETAMISTEVEQTGGTVEFKVLEPPRLPQAPSGPDRILFYSMVFVSGLGAALGLAFLLSEIRPVVYDTYTLRKISGLPVFGAVSRIMTQETKNKEYIEYGGYASTFTVLLLVFAGIMFLET